MLGLIKDFPDQAFIAHAVCLVVPIVDGKFNHHQIRPFRSIPPDIPVIAENAQL